MNPKRLKKQRSRSSPLRQHREISLKSGLPPESLVHVGRVFLENTLLELISFNAENFSRTPVTSAGLQEGIDKYPYNWLKVSGLHEVGTISDIGQKLNISQLLLEDVLNTSHRPKLEEDKNYLFFTLKSFKLEETELHTEQVTFLLGRTTLISFQENEDKYFEAVINRLANSTGKIRAKGLDYLLYNLIDVIVDNYYSILEITGDQLEDLEEQIFEDPDKELIERNKLIRKNIITIRKALIPTQEALYKLMKGEPEFIDENDLPYFSDVADHLNQCLDFIDTYRELSNEIKESYLSNLSYKMNQVVKLLTIITTIFIPLSFIAGIYGMNFQYMPELQLKYGYFFVIGFMLLLMLGMLIYFRIKKWI